MSLQHSIEAPIRPGEQPGFVAECLEIPVVTQGATLDEVAANLREAVALHVEGEDFHRSKQGSPGTRVCLRSASRLPLP